jgi:diadenosine tetraphosphate (Ap4A) HIT family hydrolase
VIAKRHAVEWHDLDAEELRLFCADVAASGQTITERFGPVKLDNLVMGHLCPHVHCHIYPQYSTDDPYALVDVQAGTVLTRRRRMGHPPRCRANHLAAHHDVAR